MRTFFSILSITIGFLTQSYSQEQFTISGSIEDAETGEELLYATISVKGKGVGATTNLYGFYSLTLPAGEYTLEYAYIGYQRKLFEIDLQKDMKIDIELSPDSKQLEEVVVTAESDDENLVKVERARFKTCSSTNSMRDFILTRSSSLVIVSMLSTSSRASCCAAKILVRSAKKLPFFENCSSNDLLNLCLY